MNDFDQAVCLCGSGDEYKDCCGRFIRGDRVASTAEQLMRSRYTAYAIKDYAYVMRTWLPSTRPSSLDDDNQPQWCDLAIISAEAGQVQDREGYVEFEAHYKLDGRPGKMHERSYFVKQEGCWFYVQGKIG
ncbi:MAG: hypothetical protein GXP22_11805 [Gammaproteobacteria bacterium]|nr:hypothetical protein [Gammaproteobacteria bacterium]